MMWRKVGAVNFFIVGKRGPAGMVVPVERAVSFRPTRQAMQTLASQRHTGESGLLAVSYQRSACLLLLKAEC
jgi:hypothetical protein